MGLLSSQGKPLSWEETKIYAEHVRRHGIKQFISTYIKNKDRQDNRFKWGEEVRIFFNSYDIFEKPEFSYSFRLSTWLSSLMKRHRKVVYA